MVIKILGKTMLSMLFLLKIKIQTIKIYQRDSVKMKFLQEKTEINENKKSLKNQFQPYN